MDHLTDLEGTWQMVRAEFAGDVAPELVTANTLLVLLAGGYEVRFQGRLVDCGSCEVSAVSGEATMVWHGREGPNAGRTIPCLFQVRGDRLRICYGLDGVPPTEMSAQTGQHSYLATYRRITS